MKKIKFLLILLVTVLIPKLNIAQIEDSAASKMYDMSLEELLNVEITVASKKALTTRESPGVVSIITEEEIKTSGVRDLIDVFQMVPGIYFGTDVSGVVGMGIRGNWGHEGKILLLLDGMEMNELYYSNNEFGNHYDVSQIKRIEIIRGPGASIYGGSAELGVINIITKQANDINGLNINGLYGKMKKTFARENLSISAGKKWNKLSLKINGFVGKGNRSDREYTDLYGTTVGLKDSSKLNPKSLNFSLNTYGLTLKYLYDDYQTTTSDRLSAIGKNIDKYFLTHLFDIKYNLKLTDKLSLTPNIYYKYQEPWSSVVQPQLFESQRYYGNLALNYDANEKVNVNFGCGVFRDVFDNDRDEIHRKFFTSFSYLQFLFKTPFANIAAGARVDKHSSFGSAFAPRIGLTKVFDKLHLKLLFSRAYKAPTVGNIVEAKTTTEPEYTNVAEAEIGYQISDNMLLKTNLYDISIDKPIVYIYDAVNQTEGYSNYKSSGTQGIEVEYQLRNRNWGYFNLNYSFYTAAGKNKVEDYAVVGNPNAMLGTPQHKIACNTHFNVYKGFSINPSLVFKGKTNAYYKVDSTGAKMKTFDSKLLINLFLSYENCLIKGLDLGFGVYNILNKDDEFYQPYSGLHAALPAPSRELIFRMSYNFGF